jgi:hypothetical protein
MPIRFLGFFLLALGACADEKPDQRVSRSESSRIYQGALR